VVEFGIRIDIWVVLCYYDRVAPDIRRQTGAILSMNRHFLPGLALALLATAVAAFSAPTLKDHSPRLGDYLGGKSNISLGLLDRSRMTINHTVQMGFSSFGGGSMMQSLYATTVGYRVSDPLSLSFTLGMTGNRINAGGVPTTFNSVVGGARLDYRPTKDLFLRLEFSRGPAYSPRDLFGERLGFASGLGFSTGDSEWHR